MIRFPKAPTPVKRRILSCVRVLFSVLVVSLSTLCCYAQDTVVRTNSSGDVTASGTDIPTVQTADGAANSDIITISGDATHNSTVNLTADLNTVTIRSSESGVKRTISTDGTNVPLYSLTESGTYTFNLSDLNYQGKGQRFMQGGDNASMQGGDNAIAININTNNVSFNGFSGDGDGGVIYNDFGPITFSENATATFTGNSSSHWGGAIYSRQDIQFSTGKYIFENNRSTLSDDVSGSGGAIHTWGSIQFLTGNYTFKNNHAGDELIPSFSEGGAIYSSQDIQFSTGKYTFENNSAGFRAGAIRGTSITFSENADVTFTGNKTLPRKSGVQADNSGGAIGGDSITFSGNATATFTGNSATDYGGAINGYDSITFSENSTATFTGNTAVNGVGGAIEGGPITFSDNATVTFTGNSANQGGAIGNSFWHPITFSGNAKATFTGNCANEAGNDIYCNQLYFKDHGTYSFDGGIYISTDIFGMYVLGTVSIDKAQVTIAGRQYRPDDPTVEDTTNNYDLQNVTISNGGNLTANLDYIDAFRGIFNLDDTAKMELNVVDAGITKKLTMFEDDDSERISNEELAIRGSGKLSKNGDGTLQILAESAGLVGAESFVVSSGRLDYKGYFTGNLKVSAEEESNPVFSPGNSVGTADVTGNVNIEDGIILFEFGSYPGDDSNHDVLNITNGRFSAGADMINLYFENGDAASWAAEEKFEYLLISGGGFANREYTSMLGNYLDTFKLLGKNGNLYLVDASPIPEAVPEPSTWALLILGVVVLFLRKRVRG